jgi:drug/metabolite transporter (DMT)-like permease
MPLAVYFQVFVATLLWGTAFPTVKLCLHFVGPLTLAGLRFLLAGSLLLVASQIAGQHGNLGAFSPGNVGKPLQWPKILLIGFLSTFVFYGLFFMGLNKTSASSAAAMDATGPVINAVMAHFILHQDRLTRRKVLALVLAFCGVLVIILGRPSGAAGAHINPAGCVLIISGLAVGAMGTMHVVRYNGGLSLARLTGIQMVFGAILLLLCAYLREGPIHWHQPGIYEFICGWVWLASVSATAFTIWYHVVRQYKITSLSAYSFLPGMWGMVLSIVFLHDPLTRGFVVGVVLVISGALVMSLGTGSFHRVFPPEKTPSPD